MERSQPEKRRNNRFATDVTVALNHPRSARRISAQLLDMSQEGCRVLTDEPFGTGAQILLKIQGLETWPAAVVWSEGRSLGLEFHRPMQVAVVEHYARYVARSAEAARSDARSDVTDS